MNDLNKVLITGVLTQEPTLRYTPTGVKTLNLRIAINERFKNTKTQEIKESTGFITAVVWDMLAENCAKYLKKGSRVLVEGKLVIRDYVDKEQQKRSVTEIKAEDVKFLDKPEKKENENERN